MSAYGERILLRQLAEVEPDEVSALAAALIGHEMLPDPSNKSGWLCGCTYLPGLGEMHARHVAEELVALQRRRAEAGR